VTTVAVTGASGFVGRHVLAALAERGAAVIDTSRTGSAPAGVSARARWMRLDVHDPDATTLEVLRQADAVIHLAWGGLPNYHSPHHVESELPAQREFLTDLMKSGTHVVVAGTCLEYGMQAGELTERMPSAPVVEYAIAKDRLRRSLDEAPFTWARLFYMYGAGQSPNALWSQLTAAVRAGDEEFGLSGARQYAAAYAEQMDRHAVALGGYEFGSTQRKQQQRKAEETGEERHAADCFAGQPDYRFRITNQLDIRCQDFHLVRRQFDHRGLLGSVPVIGDQQATGTLFPVREDRRGTGDMETQPPVRLILERFLFQGLLNGNCCLVPVSIIALFGTAEADNCCDEDEISVGNRALDALSTGEQRLSVRRNRGD
jgi:hypothetical protein